MSRILVVHPGPDFSVADVYRGWIKSMRKLGHQIMVYNTNELDRLTFYGNVVFQDKEVEPCEHGFGPVRAAMPDPEMIAQMATKGLFESCYTFWPDVIFFISAFFQTNNSLHILRKRGHKIVMLHTESPYQDDEQMQRGASWGRSRTFRTPTTRTCTSLSSRASTRPTSRSWAPRSCPA
jgi:hypothetical protein